MQKNKITLYESSREILSYAENKIIYFGTRSEGELLNKIEVIASKIIGGYCLVSLGIKLRILQVVFTVAITMCIAFFLILFNSSGDGKACLSAALLFSFLLTVFAVPSQYVTMGIKETYIGDIKDKIKGDIPPEKLDDLRRNIDIFRTVCNTRVKSCRLFVLFLWGGFAYLGTSFLESAKTNSANSHSFPTLLIILLAVILFGKIIIDAYDNSCRVIFNTIDFACNELSPDKKGK